MRFYLMGKSAGAVEELSKIREITFCDLLDLSEASWRELLSVIPTSKVKVAAIGLSDQQRETLANLTKLGDLTSSEISRSCASDSDISSARDTLIRAATGLMKENKLINPWVDFVQENAKRDTDGIPDSAEEVIQQANAEGPRSTMDTGIAALDQIIGGLPPGQLIVLASRPAMGKRTLGLGIAGHVGRRNSGGVAAIFSLDLSKEGVGFQLLAQESGTPCSRLQTGKLLNSEWISLSQGADSLSKATIFLDDRSALSVAEIRACCQTLYRDRGRIDLVMIDYLQLIKGTIRRAPGTSRVHEISEITRDLKTLAEDLGCCVLVLSQLNRGIEARPNKRPMLSDLRKSAATEPDVDVVMFLYRDEIYNPETSDNGITEVIIAKNRSGKTDTIRVKYDAAIPRFTDLAETEREPYRADPAQLQRIKESVNIVELIGGHTVLQKNGSHYVGLCPFHTERTPSFSVSEEKQLYHCYSCKKGGDVISFLMDIQNMSLPDAVKELTKLGKIESPL